MSTAAVFERRNKQIQDAIDSQNLKQALQLCEKRLKKGEDTPFLRAWKANILYNHADATHHDRGVAGALELCHSKPPLTDINALEMVQNTLGDIEEHTETARALWENAAKAKPTESDIQLRWFNVATENNDWKTAQKAAMSLQSNFPKTRKYYFWAILMCYLIAEAPNSSDADRNLFGTLAYRMVSKAASSVPTNPKELLSPGRAIQTAEELMLLIKIYSFRDCYEDILTLLNSQHLGIGSSIVQNDWSFVSAKLNALEKTEHWREGLTYVRELLNPQDSSSGSNGMGSREKDDWTVWSFLLRATQKLEETEAIKSAEEFISDYVEKFPKSRNAQLASLELTQYKATKKSASLETLLTECKGYFDRNGAKVHCFSDLRRYVSTLEPALQESFQHYISGANSTQEKSDDASTTVRSINALKFEYCCRLFSQGDSESRPRVEDFSRRCLRLFASAQQPDVGDSQSTIETQPTDDLCLLTSMSLIRLHETSSNPESYQAPSAALVQAAAILDHLILKSPHNYEALLLLTRIYLLLGAGSLALKSFSKLTVKQIQYETVAHNLFARLATIHPHSAPPFDGLDLKDTDPQIALRQALSFYRGSETSIPYTRKTGLEKGSYINVEKSIDFQNSLQNSICRKMWALETRRIQRLVGGPSTNQYDHIVSNPAPVVDKRNFDGFMNCEPVGRPSFEEHVRLGPLPGAQSVKAMTQTDILFRFLNKTVGQKKLPAADLDLPPVEVDLDLPETQLTPAEVQNSKIHLILLKLISSILSLCNKSKGDSTSVSADIDDLISKLESWLMGTHTSLLSSSNLQTTQINIEQGSSSPNPSNVASWIYFHGAYSTLETLKAVTLFTAFALKLKMPPSPPASLTKDKLSDLDNVVASIIEDIKSQTRTLKGNIAEPGLLGKLVGLVTNGLGAGVQTGEAGRDEEPSLSTKLEDFTLSNQIEELIGMSSLELFCGSLMESWEENLDGVLNVCASYA